MDKVRGMGSCHPGNLATICHLVGSTLVHSMSAFAVCTVPHFGSSQPACAGPPCSGQFFKGLGYRVHFSFLDAFLVEQDVTQDPNPKPFIFRMILFCHKHNCCISSPSKL